MVLRQLTNGISYLHTRNIIHRDLKLENIMISSPPEHMIILERDPEEWFRKCTLKIVDFGLSKELDEENGMTQTYAGSQLTMAPEIISQQQYGLGADIYSLGAILFFLGSLRYPRTINVFEDLEQQFSKPLVFTEKCCLSQAIKELILKTVSYTHLTLPTIYSV